MDKVSVIVPAYNVENYLEACVDSLEKQTYTNVEIILVEDCSTDNTRDVCRRMAEKYRNIILMEHEENQGLEATREDGIVAATGKWIMFLDSDDVYLLDGIERVMSLANQCDPDIILCPYAKVVDGISTPIEHGLDDGIYTAKEICERVFTKIPLNFLSCIGSKVYRREFIIRNDIHFDKRFKFNEDGGYIYTCLLYAQKIVAANIPFYQYNIRTEGSIQSSYRKNMYMTISNADHFLRDVLMHHGCFEGDNSIRFYKKRASTMLAALVNEVQYRGYRDYLAIVNTIRCDEDFSQVWVLANNRSVGRMARFMVFSLKYHMEWFFFLALTARKYTA